MQARAICWLRAAALLATVAVLAPATALAQEQPFDVKAHYTKQVYEIPMRDGVKLYTVVYSPKETSQKYPILLNRTPYSVRPYEPEAYKTAIGPSDVFMREGYIFAYQDVRGRYMSEGQFVDVRPMAGGKQIDESTDTYDTIDWLVKNVPNNNGRVGIYGISYPGFYAAAGVVNAHPALKAASPQAPLVDWFVGDDFHHNGAFFLLDAFRFYSGFGQPRPAPTTEGARGFEFPNKDHYQFFLDLGPIRNANERYFKGNIAFWNDLMRHGTYDDFWKARSLPPHLKNVKPAVMTVGGLFDAEDLYGPLKTYETIESSTPGAFNMLVMGPWSHGQWSRDKGERLGCAEFGDETSRWYNANVELPFFNYFLKDKGEMTLPEAVVYDTGADMWGKFDAWPAKGLQVGSLYFAPDGSLSREAPKASGESFDEYVSDPENPVPFTADVTINRSRTYMTEDQRFASRRPDVLVFETPVLEEDVTLAGPITASLFVSTTGTDADFVVKVIDVHPDSLEGGDDENCDVPLSGYQMLVRWEVMRGKFRNSFERPEPFVPGQVTPVTFQLRDVLHTFKKGHRIMVQVQSSMFPLIDRNPQKFVDIYSATEADFQKATIRVHRSAAHPSHVSFGVLRHRDGQPK